MPVRPFEPDPLVSGPASLKSANQTWNETAHTISQRLRTLKKIPPELIPLGFVLCVAVGAAAYSLVRKLYTDKTLRLYRQGPEKSH
jgi:hypothetical protein